MSLFVAFVLSVLFIIFENRNAIHSSILLYFVIDSIRVRHLLILINTVAGTLLITNTFVQQGIGLSSFETGLLSLTYLIAVLTMIRVGEKILQEFGPRNLC